MLIALRIAGLIIGVWAGFKLASIGIAWLKEGFKRITPHKYD